MRGNEGLEGVPFAQVIAVYEQENISWFITQDLGHHTVEYDFDEGSLRICGTGTEMFLDRNYSDLFSFAPPWAAG